MSEVHYGLAEPEGPSRAVPGAARRRRAILAGGCALAASALLMASTQASSAATGGQWRDYTVPLSGGTLTGGIYASSSNNAWAAGTYSHLTSHRTEYAHFNGASWSSVSGPQIGSAWAVGGDSASDVWVFGGATTARYNGSGWITYKPYLPKGDTYYPTIFFRPEVYSAGQGDAWAEVPVNTRASVVETLLEHFNGTAWSLANVPGVTPSATVVEEITGSGPDDLYVAVGSNSPSGFVGLLHFDGTSWSKASPPDDADMEAGTELTMTGPGDGLATGVSESDGVKAYAAQLTAGSWALTSLPVKGYFPVQGSDGSVQASGTSRLWIDLSRNGYVIGAPGTPELWQWSAGTWQRIAANPYPGITAVADGSGLWSGNTKNSVALYEG